MADTALAQLSDPHIEVGPRDRASAAALAAAVRAVLALKPLPDAVLVSGDLANSGRAAEYERVRELLAPLSMPVFVLAGNHDDPDAVREYFALADGATGAAGGPLRYTARVGPLRLIACDTNLPGTDAGAFDFERRAWLEAELAADRESATIVAMHHPPLRMGIRPLDRLCLPEPDRAGLAELLALAPQARRVISGHIHRGVFDTLGGCGVVACPSTYLQAPLELPGDDPVELVPEPAGFVLHVLVDGADLATHFQPIER